MAHRDRVAGALYGQAAGDALGAPTEGMSQAEIRARHGWVDGFLSSDPAGTDDTEYAVLTAQLILAHGDALTSDDVSAAWRATLVDQVGGFRGGGFSEMTAINNLRDGLSAPISGSDNHEMWSDGSAMRIAPVGVFCAGDPEGAARLAAVEASVSHAGDGVFCAQAMAAAVSVAMVSDSWEAVLDAGLAAVPADSWTGRSLRRGVEIGSAGGSRDEHLQQLYDEVSIFFYPWADVGPEAVALAFGVFASARGDYVESVLSGVNVGRDADTIAAMAGALAGALHGIDAVPTRWRDAVRVIRGHCIAATAGVDLEDLADALHAAAQQRAGTR
jgi:ADP-ribosylglycohydrolase